MVQTGAIPCIRIYLSDIRNINTRRLISAFLAHAIMHMQVLYYQHLMKSTFYFAQAVFMRGRLSWVVGIAAAGFLSHDCAGRAQIFNLANDVLAIMRRWIDHTKEGKKKIFMDFNGSPGRATRG